MTKMTVELLKHLLHQRQQIPLQYDVIKRDVLNMQSKENGGDENLPTQGTKKQTTARKEQLRQRYLKKAAELVETSEDTFIALDEEIQSNAEDIIAVHFLFGATPVSPKETYSLMFPTRWSNTTCADRVRPGLQLFRSMVTHDKLFSLISSSLGVTGVYTMVERRKRGNYETEPWFVSRSEFRLTSRGTRVRFQLRQSPPQDRTFRHPIQTAETVQRLSFDSGCGSEPSSGGFSKLVDNKTPARIRQLSGNAPTDRYTPTPMELCTPLMTSRSIVTAPRTPGLGKSGNHLCVSNAMMNLTTPRTTLKVHKSVDHEEEDMVPCTPFHGGIEVCFSSPEEGETVLQELESVCMSEVEWLVCPRPIRGFKDNLVR